MHIEGVAIIPRCAECEAHWLPADEVRWQAWLTDDEPPEVVFYCPGVCRARVRRESHPLIEAPLNHVGSKASVYPFVLGKSRWSHE